MLNTEIQNTGRSTAAKQLLLMASCWPLFAEKATDCRGRLAKLASIHSLDFSHKPDEMYPEEST